MNSKRNIQIQSRLTQTEHDKLKTICHRYEMSISEFIRNSIKYMLIGNKDEAIFSRDQKFKKEILYELHRYGNNLNQVARDLNTLLAKNQLTLADDLVKDSIRTIDEIDNKINGLTKIVCKRI